MLRVGQWAVLGVTLVAVGMFLAPATSEADPVSCLTNPYPCYASTGETYDGVILGTDTPDGNDTEEAVEAVTGVDLTLVNKFDPPTEGGDFDFDPDDLNGVTVFDWSYSGSLTLAFLTVKAGDGFGVYDISGLTSGSVDLDDLFVDPQTAPGTSHVSFWTGEQTTQVPEPSSLIMLGSGLVGVAMAMRRRRHRR